MARVTDGGRTPALASRPRTVAVVAFDGVQLLDVTGPAEVFTTANVFGANYDVRIISPDGADVCTSSGVRVGVDSGLSPRRVVSGFPCDGTPHPDLEARELARKPLALTDRR